MGAQVGGWTPTGRRSRARRKLKRAAIGYAIAVADYEAAGKTEAAEQALWHAWVLLHRASLAYSEACTR